MEKSMNATDLFRMPINNFHNSESAWSSLFAYQLIDASSKDVELSIPVYVYMESQGGWSFEEQEREPLKLPHRLNFSSVLVEGILSTESIKALVKGLANPLPIEFSGLRPDITLRMGDKSLVFIETKTVGAAISQKEQLYFKLAEWLIGQGINAKTYILLSAGHESNSQVTWLASTEWKTPTLILWEQFFKAIEQQVNEPLISRIIPNLKQFYDNEEEYMGSKTA
jgi:hypothetical protein